MFYVRAIFSTALVSAAILFSGCHSKTSPTPDNYIAALNTHFADHPQCLMPNAPRFPLEISENSDPVQARQMDALAAAQLLEVKREQSIRISRYTLTPMGTRTGSRFCYGHRHITAINSSTPPAVANGFPETHVTYTYEMEDVPVWAKTPQVQQAFPEMAKAISGSSTDTATLARTLAGWTVPD